MIAPLPNPASSTRAPAYGAVPPVHATAPITRRDEEHNPERSAPLTGNGAAVAPTTQPVTLPGRPRRRPTIPSRPAHIAGVTLQGRQVSLAPQLDSIVSALRAGNLYVRPIGQQGHEPMVNPTVAPVTATIATYAFVTQFGIFAPQLNSNLFSTMYVDGSSFTLVGSEVFNGLSVGVSGLMADGWAGSYLTFNIAQPANMLLSLGIQLQFWKDYLRLGGTFVHANLTNLTFIALSLSGAINVQRDTSDLGAYNGPDAEQLAKAHNLNFWRDGMRQVELRQMYNKTLSLRAGGGSFKVAGLGRFDYVRGTQTVFRTLVSTKQAHDIVFEGHGLRQYFIDRLRAMGWKKEIINIPSQHATDVMREGDEVIKTRSKTITSSAIGGNLALFAGLQLFGRNDHEVAAHKLDENRMEVVFNPTRIRDVGTYLYSPFGPEADVGLGKARSIRQSFIFDLKEPEARAAYHAAIQGNLPNNLDKYVPTDQELRGEQALKDTVRRQNAALPKGVTRSYVHLIRSQEKRGGFGAYWRIVPRIFLPKQWLNILATHYNRVHELQAISDGNLVDCADNRFIQHRHELLFYGLRTTETAAQRRHMIDEKDARTFFGLTLESTLYDGCLRRLAANKEFVKRVNTMFEKNYDRFKRPGHKQQRQVDIVRMFTPLEVDALADYAKLWRPDPDHPLTQTEAAVLTSRLHRATRATGLRFGSVRRLLDKVSKARPGDPRAAVVQPFVQDHAVRAFSLINRLLPDERNLMVSTTSSTYANSLQRAARMALLYYEPLRGGESPKLVRQRFKDVFFTLGRIQRALADLDDDPMMGNDREVMRADLEEARESMYALLRMEEGESDLLLDALKLSKPRWRSSKDQIIVYTIEDPQHWVRRADALAAAAQGRPLPADATGLAKRWAQMQRVARRLRHRIAWLKGPVPTIAEPERTERLAAYKGALKRLEGLLNVGILPPAKRCALRAQLRPMRRNRNIKCLREALCPRRGN